MTETFTPPTSVAKEAQRALDAKEEYGDDVKGGTRVGWTRANQLAKREPISLDTIKRMVSFFARHEGNQKFSDGKKWYEDAGRVAWLIWGGDAGKSWANKILDQNKKEEKMVSMKEQISDKNIEHLGDILGIDWDVVFFSIDDFRKGVEVEVEHLETSGGDLFTIANIALDHLNEYPDYYDRLEDMEDEAEYFWATKEYPMDESMRLKPGQILFLEDGSEAISKTGDYILEAEEENDRDKEQIDNLKQKIDDIKQDIASIDEQIASLQKDKADLGEQVAQLQSDIADIQAR